MIGQYSITASAAKIKDRFSVDVPDFYQPFFNASPTSLLPVIMHTSPAGISTFYWGTSPEWSKGKPLSEKIVNTQAELITEKTSLKKALMKNRCLIPADGFYAWKKTGKKTLVPYRFVCTDQEIFSIAGLWDEYEDTDGKELHTFSMITTPSNKLVGSVHDRMPVIMDKKTEAVWLSKESSEDDLMKILTAYPDSRMNHYSVSPRISDKNTNVPSLIIPTPPADQFGNLTLFD
jgi:putative SOS response-associated peptidase YedK